MHWKTTEYAREKARAWRLANPEWVREYRRANRRAIYLKESFRKYGITAEQYELLLAAQGNACATCRKSFDWGDKQTKPHIDHCHDSGRVRGLLCNRCNTILGLVTDDAELLRNLAAYL